MRHVSEVLSAKVWVGIGALTAIAGLLLSVCGVIGDGSENSAKSPSSTIPAGGPTSSTTALSTTSTLPTTTTQPQIPSSSPTTLPALSGVTYLRQLNAVRENAYLSASFKWGYHDMAGQRYYESLALRDSGRTALIELDLGGRYNTFKAYIGMRADAPTGTTKTIEIDIDGTVHIFPVAAATAARPITLAVGGAQRLIVRSIYNTGEKQAWVVIGTGRVIRQGAIDDSPAPVEALN